MSDEKKHCLLRGTLYNKEKETVGKIFDDGIRHPKLSDTFTLILNDANSLYKGRTWTDMVACSTVNAGLLFLISGEAEKKLKENTENDLQFFNLEIKSSDFTNADYKIVKVLDKIDCVDLDLSDVEYDAKYDAIDSAEELVLDEEKIPKGKKIFLLGKRATGIIVISEMLKNVILQSGLTGFNFYSLEEAYKVIM